MIVLKLSREELMFSRHKILRSLIITPNLAKSSKLMPQLQLLTYMLNPRELFFLNASVSLDQNAPVKRVLVTQWLLEPI